MVSSRFPLRNLRSRYLVALVASAAVVIIATFPWFDYQDRPDWSRAGWMPLASARVRLRDIVLNVLLCVPIGWSSRRLAYGSRAVLLSIVIVLPVSLFAEWTQLYSRTRFPMASDVLANVGGAILGVILFPRRVPAARARRRREAPKSPPSESRAGLGPREH